MNDDDTVGEGFRQPLRKPSLMGHFDRTSRRGQRRCIALIDARFWWWLKDSEDDHPSLPEGLQEEVVGMAFDAGADVLSRIYWYTDDDRRARAPGVVTRQVPHHGHDGGVALLRQMGSDLREIAEQRGAERVLLISDDERLLLAVDQAQLAGVDVAMVVDESSQDLDALRDEDPSWTRLLLQADRLIVLGSWRNRRAAGQRERQVGVADRHDVDRRGAPSPEAQSIITAEVSDWWSSESEDQRQQWAQEFDGARGLPQALDRELLLRISRVLGQALSPGEKSAMRYKVREVVLGPSKPTPAPGPDGAVGLGTDSLGVQPVR